MVDEIVRLAVGHLAARLSRHASGEMKFDFVGQFRAQINHLTSRRCLPPPPWEVAVGPMLYRNRGGQERDAGRRRESYPVTSLRAALSRYWPHWALGSVFPSVECTLKSSKGGGLRSLHARWKKTGKVMNEHRLRTTGSHAEIYHRLRSTERASINPDFFRIFIWETNIFCLKNTNGRARAREMRAKLAIAFSKRKANKGQNVLLPDFPTGLSRYFRKKIQN